MQKSHKSHLSKSLGILIIFLITISTANTYGKVTPGGTTPTDGYVTRIGNRLMLNGKPYKFTGLNIYNANSINNCWYTMGTGNALDTALTSIDNGTGSRAKVIRAWFFQSLSTTNGVRDWAPFDHTIAVARSRGFKIVVTLGNQWADCDGAWPSDSAGFKNEQWYGTNYSTLAGSAPGLPQSYRDYVRDVVTRYKDESAIAIWQLINEAEDPVSLGGVCSTSSAATLRSFADDMGTLVKGIDSNHLLSLGTIGGGQCGAQGEEYKTVHASPNIDLCEYHDYGFPTESMPGDQWNGLQVRINHCNALGKPLFIGESGMTSTYTGGNLQTRANYIEAKFAAQFGAGIVGELIWAWGNLPSTGSYEVTVGDPMLAVLDKYGRPNNLSTSDFDGDGKTDFSIFRPGPGQWWYLRSSDFGNRGYAFGLSTDKLVPADFTGDGKADIAIWRPSDGFWYILRSEDNSFYAVPFGTNGDIPAPGDFDGDGKADTAVYRPSTTFWYIQNSSGGTTFQQFGVAEDKPIVEDYDGDGKDDIAVFRPSLSQWWQLRSTAGVIGYQFGAAGDKTVQGDFTGDGKADVAVFRPTNGFWYILRSENSSFYSVPFGIPGDIPVIGDYDGDGKADTAVFRPSDNFWYVQGSSSGFFQALFGQSGDKPVPAVFSAP